MRGGETLYPGQGGTGQNGPEAFCSQDSNGHFALIHTFSLVFTFLCCPPSAPKNLLVPDCPSFILARLKVHSFTLAYFLDIYLTSYTQFALISVICICLDSEPWTFFLSMTKTWFFQSCFIFSLIFLPFIHKALPFTSLCENIWSDCERCHLRAGRR